MNLTIDKTYVITYNDIHGRDRTYKFTIKPIQKVPGGWVMFIVTNNNQHGYKQTYYRKALMEYVKKGSWTFDNPDPSIELPEELFHV